MTPHVMSSHYITSHRVTTHNRLRYKTISYHQTTSHYAVFRHSTSHHTTLHHGRSQCITFHRITSHCIIISHMADHAICFTTWCCAALHTVMAQYIRCFKKRPNRSKHGATTHIIPNYNTAELAKLNESTIYRKLCILDYMAREHTNRMRWCRCAFQTQYCKIWLYLVFVLRTRHGPYHTRPRLQTSEHCKPHHNLLHYTMP